MPVNTDNLDGVPYAPTAGPIMPVGGGVGLPQAKNVVPWHSQQSDQSIYGALKVNPAFAADFVSGRLNVQYPAKGGVGGDQEPLIVKSLSESQAIATAASPNAWKKRTLDSTSDSVRFGDRAPQKPFQKPWNKKFIPPLAIFNDASQWVNTLLLNQPMQASGNGNSMPNIRAQYFTPPPVATNNLAAGTLNAQLQLGILAIQTQQLTISASNYFGGS
jgi:hypothetical protein